MMRGKVPQQWRPLRHGTNSTGGMERRALGRNSGLSSSVILLLRCLFVGIVVYSGCSAAFASEAPSRAMMPHGTNPQTPTEDFEAVSDRAMMPDETNPQTPTEDSEAVSDSSTRPKTQCEAVVTPVRNRFSWRRIFKKWTEDRLLVGVGWRVIRLSCYLRKDDKPSTDNMEKCYVRAASICGSESLGRSKLDRMIFEVAEADRPWLKKKILGFRDSRTRQGNEVVSMHLFLSCQFPRSVDEKRNRCQGGKKMHYYNELFDSYQHAKVFVGSVGTVESKDQLPAAENEFAGRVFVRWGQDVVVDCGDGEKSWSTLMIRNSWSPLFLDGMQTPQILPDDCKISGAKSLTDFVYSRQSFDSYRYDRKSATEKYVIVHGQLRIRRYRVPEIFPFRLPDLGEDKSAQIVHIKLLDYSILPYIKKTQAPFQDDESTITTITCRSGDRVKSLKKCFARVSKDFKSESTIFVSTDQYRYLLQFLNMLVPGLEDSADIQNLDRYRFIIEGESSFLKGVTPLNPTLYKEPVALPADAISLITAPVKPVLWPSYSKIDWIVHEIHLGDQEKRLFCVGQINVTFDSSQWNFATRDGTLDVPGTTYKTFYLQDARALLRVRPTLPHIMSDGQERMIARNKTMFLTPKGSQDDNRNLIDLTCASPLGGRAFGQTMSQKGVTIEPSFKLSLRSTVMFHVV